MAQIEDAVGFSSSIGSGNFSFGYFLFGWLPKKKHIQKIKQKKKLKDNIAFYVIKKQLATRLLHHKKKMSLATK